MNFILINFLKKNNLRLNPKIEDWVMSFIRVVRVTSPTN